MLQTLRRNFGLKVLSFGLAVLAWAYFHFSAGPSIGAHFDQQLSVPIVVSGLHPGLVATFPEHTAIVTLEAPRNGPPVRADQVEAVIDLGARDQPGILNVPVKVVAPDLTIKSLAPSSITLSLDRLAVRSLPVSISYGTSSGTLVVASSSVSPAVTSVRGIANDLAKVESIRVEVPLGTKPGDFDEMVRPVAVDAAGNEIAGLQVSPNLVRVQAHFVPATNSAGVKS